jgi:hypothetical protein
MSSVTFRAGRAPGGVIEQVFPITGGMGKPDRMLIIDSNGEVALTDGPTL